MKRMKVLALVLAFALATMGGAYALWSDTLMVEETVQTGIVDLQWASAFMVDPDPNYTGHDGDVYGTDDNRDGLDTMDPGNPNENKNIGSFQAAIKTDGGNDKVTNRDTLELTLTNGYPGYQEYVDAVIKNVGTVPVKLDYSISGKPGWLEVAFYNPETGEVFADLVGKQVDPDQELKVRIVNRVLNNAPQEVERTFSIKLTGIQWNAYNWADELPNEITFPRQDNFPYPADED